MGKINIKSLPGVDVFLCSPPCQGMSKIGSRQRDDPRNQLYQTPLRYARLKRPQIFMLENVPQFAKMRAFPGFICSLKLTYKFVKYQILDSSHFGSIQSRKRLFVIGKNSDFAFPRPKKARPRKLPLDPPTVYLSEKGVAYLKRRSKWGVKIYPRDAKAIVGTIPRSYGHMITWKHIIKENNGKLRSITANEALKIMGYNPKRLDLNGISQRQRFYLAGNSIDLKLLKKILAAVL